MGDTAEQFSLQNFRPDGYEYPVGLSRYTISSLANAATNTTGGTQTIDGTNAVHTFSSTSPGSGTFIPSFTGTIELLIVAGGGAGSSGPTGSPEYIGFGGGGAGGLIYNSAYPVSASSPYSITVGAGGAAGANGSNSSFSSLLPI